MLVKYSAIDCMTAELNSFFTVNSTTLGSVAQLVKADSYLPQLRTASLVSFIRL